jgi:hypothetical protein
MITSSGVPTSMLPSDKLVLDIGEKLSPIILQDIEVLLVLYNISP